MKKKEGRREADGQRQTREATRQTDRYGETDGERACTEKHNIFIK